LFDNFFTQRRGGAEDAEEDALPANSAHPSLTPGIREISIEWENLRTKTPRSLRPRASA